MTDPRENIEPCKTAQSKLKIGLIVGSTQVSLELRDWVMWCLNHESLTISRLFLTDKVQETDHSVKSRILSAIANLETYLWHDKPSGGTGHVHDLRRLIPDVVTLPANASATEIPHDIGATPNTPPYDLLLMIGCDAWPEGLSESARLGALRIHYSHGGPAGFWDAFFKHDYTGFAILHLDGSMLPESNLISGRIATQYCYSLNRLRVERKCLHYAKQLLSRISLNQNMPEPSNTIPMADNLLGMPGLPTLTAYLLKLAYRHFQRAIRSAFRLDFKWSVAYQKRGWQEADMASAVKIPRPDQHFLADPFVVSEGGKDYCFLEDYDFSTAKGHVAVYELHDDRAECLGNPLIEPFHLSFPYMFRYKSELYMCPETSRNRQIRVYKCIDFPLQWQLHSVLMDNVSAAETMLFEHSGRWWMLTNMDVTDTGDYCTELSIYWADSPLSSHWTAHPANPVFIDAAKGRNAGLLFDSTHIYRVAQRQGFERYGKAFTINRIDQLDEKSYRETEVRSVQADFFKGLKGTHHMHGTGNVTVFDFI